MANCYSMTQGVHPNGLEHLPVIQRDKARSVGQMGVYAIKNWRRIDASFVDKVSTGLPNMRNCLPILQKSRQKSRQKLMQITLTNFKNNS